MTFDIDMFINVLWIGAIVGIISTAVIQKIKETKIISNRVVMSVVAFLTNLCIAFGFCFLFTNLALKYMTFVALISWVGADILYNELHKRGLLKGLSEIGKEEK